MIKTISFLWYTCDIKLDKWNWTFKYICIQLHGHFEMSQSQLTYLMTCIYRFDIYAAHALYKRPPYAIESRWLPRVRGMYAVHTPLAPWIHDGQVRIRDIICSGIAIHTPYAPHVRHPCAIDSQLICKTCEIVALEMFHQTISAILLHIYSFCRTLYKCHGSAGQWKRGITRSISNLEALALKITMVMWKRSKSQMMSWCAYLMT